MISKTIGFRGLAYFQTHPNTEKMGRGWHGGAEVDYGSLQKEIENQLRVAKLQAKGRGRGLRWDGLGIDQPYMILDVHVSS